MNILPKKRWHVRTKENIERVRRDEAQAAEEEKERLRKIALAEQEARTNLLRQRAQKRQHEIEDDHTGTSAVEAGSSSGQLIQFTKEGHINLFADLEEGKKQGGIGNKDYEEEKRAEKEKAEKAIGLLTYLGQSSLEAQTSKPWYTHSREKRRKMEETRDAKKDEFDTKRKAALDPLNCMTKYIEVKHKQKQAKEKHTQQVSKDTKHKHKVKSQAQTKQPSSTKTIQQLRAERMKRETEERLKTERLLAKMRGESVPADAPEPVMDERQRGYNSQFNPEFVRKPKPRRDKHY